MHARIQNDERAERINIKILRQNQKLLSSSKNQAAASFPCDSKNRLQLCFPPFESVPKTFFPPLSLCRRGFINFTRAADVKNINK